MKAAHRLELDRLFAAKNKLLIGDVIDAARPAKSPLHSCFTWDIKKGFEENLRREARDLIQNYWVVVEVVGQEPVRTRAFVSLSTDRIAGGGYRGVGEVLDNEEMTETLLKDALADLERFVSKYRRLQQLAGVVREIDSLLEREQKREQQRKPKPKKRKPQPEARP